jgi:hypothetical protein
MPRISRRQLRILFGTSLLFLGAAGLGLPVLQGWFFILLGILVLAEDIPFFARLAARLKKGFSAAARA